MNEDAEKQWLVVDGVIIKLKRAKWWMTSLDPWTKHIDAALEQLEQAKKLLEKK